MFVRASRFALERIAPGPYDMRYLNRDIGRIRRFEPFEATREKTHEGDQCGGWIAGLYDAVDGNGRHDDIGPSEFLRSRLFLAEAYCRRTGRPE